VFNGRDDGGHLNSFATLPAACVVYQASPGRVRHAEEHLRCWSMNTIAESAGV